MRKKIGEMKIISDNDCPIETISGFNERIAELIVMKFSKEAIEKIVNEYDEGDMKHDK